MTRGRKPLINPTRPLHLHLDAELFLSVQARLWSEAEGRVPKGAYQLLITEALVRLLRQRPLDLSPFLGSLPSEHVVYAFPGTQEVLKAALERSTGRSAPSSGEIEMFIADTLKDKPV